MCRDCDIKWAKETEERERDRQENGIPPHLGMTIGSDMVSWGRKPIATTTEEDQDVGLGKFLGKEFRLAKKGGVKSIQISYLCENLDCTECYPEELKYRKHQMPYQIIDETSGKQALAWVPPGEIEAQSLEQIKQISRMPFIFKYVAVMPDAHWGKGACVGSMIPTDRAIIPAAVGVDIGCGMIAIKTSLTMDDMPEDLSDIRIAIEQQIPLSAGKYNNSVHKKAKPAVQMLERDAGDRLEFYDKLAGSKRDWRNQLGTLGGGNHFIEIVKDENDDIWAFLHSGSRGIGNKIAMNHIRVAQELMEKYYIDLPNDDLAYLVEGTDEFKKYITDLKWAQKFAWENRKEMMRRVISILEHRFPTMVAGEMIACHHNFTQKENHFNKNIWVSRKGAISARKDEMGLIPGSMGTASYVVRGLGNEKAFNTAPHGAGRRFSRNKANAKFTMEDFDIAMKGIEVRRSDKFRDELPGRVQGYRSGDGIRFRLGGNSPHVHADRERQGFLVKRHNHQKQMNYKRQWDVYKITRTARFEDYMNGRKIMRPFSTTVPDTKFPDEVIIGDSDNGIYDPKDTPK